jgi:hypothetical protein
MSTSAAIEAVTTTLRNVLAPVTQSVTAGSLDRVRSGNPVPQLNLFLYEVAANAALRNMEPPTTRGGTGLHPPLALDLRYLLTAYGDADDDDARAHGLLGEAMRILHDNAVLSPEVLESAMLTAGVHLQFERVRVTPVHLSLEEVSKLWTAFQTNYRLSVAYQASVVVIDATPGRAALPVLRRGRGPTDDGPRVTSGSAPVLRRLRVEAWRGNDTLPARTGDRLIIEGEHLGPDAVAVFRHPRAPEVVQPVDAASTAERVVVPLPAGVPAGFATVAVQLDQGTEPPLASNTLPVAVATRLGAISKAPGDAGFTDVTIPCDRIADGQAVVLLLGDRQVPAVLPVTAGTDLAFRVPDPPSATTYVARVRVDGVDSVPLVEPDADPAVPLPTAWDPGQQVSLP